MTAVFTKEAPLEILNWIDHKIEPCGTSETKYYRIYNLALTLYLKNTVHGHAIFNEKIVIILTECFKQVSKSSFEQLLWNTWSCFYCCFSPSRLSFRISHSRDGVWFICVVEICEHVFHRATTYYNIWLDDLEVLIEYRTLYTQWKGRILGKLLFGNLSSRADTKVQAKRNIFYRYVLLPSKLSNI